MLESAPAPPDGLKIKDIPIPKAEKGKVLIQVKAFGLNRSGTCEMSTPFEDLELMRERSSRATYTHRTS